MCTQACNFQHKLLNQVLPDEDASFRIQALDTEDLFERLKLASHMLREKKTFTRQLMEKAGLKLKGEEDFDEDF